MPKPEEYLDLINSIVLKYGVRGMTMEQIAARIGVTKRTLYNNFGTKEELLTAIIDSNIAKFREVLLRISSQPYKSAISIQFEILDVLARQTEDTSQLFMQSLYENYHDIYLYLRSKSERMVREFFAMNVPRGRSEGLYRSDFDIDIIATLAFGAMECMREDWSASQPQYSRHQVRTQIVTFMVRGMVTSKGAELLEKEIRLREI